ncbi:hypothetical protein TOPH_00777 [Tolypocladium ophioglossoides CBS 100239]|uniref:Uncharacterized protein n=1 Tax=Tolypocladium ophioglossoides (strain CBS 100239) TaxID=1163406 RepID=A0A0L0NKG1_TOLOC|nr:hypothetical protein TOPH_00777 [Tolypocladium ophioglossoides CBS 100239]
MLATTFEQKYHLGSVSSREACVPEFRTGYRGLHVPRLGKERRKDEAESLQFMQQHTNIPVPTALPLRGRRAYYLIAQYVEGVSEHVRTPRGTGGYLARRA